MNILVTGALASPQTVIRALEKAGNTVYFMQYEKDPLPCEADNLDAVICNSLFTFHSIDNFKSLKTIQLTSAGLDRVPLDIIRNRGIKLYNARGVYSVPMAEFALCGVLQLYKKSSFFYENGKNGVWEKDRTLKELYGKTVAIVGCGSVGIECAKRFNAFGCKTIGFDIDVSERPYIDEIYGISSLTVKIGECDIVLLTLPLVETTYRLFDSQMFSKMKEGSVLVNISRGGVVDTDALVNALDTRLYGAVLDVFETEPLPSSHTLWGKRNVIITPHNSFVGDNNSSRLNELIIKNLK